MMRDFAYSTQKREVHDKIQFKSVLGIHNQPIQPQSRSIPGLRSTKTADAAFNGRHMMRAKTGHIRGTTGMRNNLHLLPHALGVTGNASSLISRIKAQDQPWLG